jgi:biopolymer transport protein TolR
VTPLVDVVLVLLIIFMVVQPLLQRGYEVQVPPNAPPTPNQPPPTDQIIVSLTANKEYYLNKQKVEPANIEALLRESLKGRGSKVVFFSAEDSVKYDDIVRNSGSGDKKVNIGIVMDWVNPAAAATP